MDSAESNSEFYATLLESKGCQHVFEKLEHIENSARQAALRKLKARQPPPGRKSKPNQTKPKTSTPSPRKRIKKLPALNIDILQRQKVMLDLQGRATLGIEEIVQYREEEPDNRLSPLHFDLHRTCSADDEVILMPCHTRQGRQTPLEVELWPEPIRDRNKRWMHDELPRILSGLPQVYRMTRCRANGETYRDRWNLQFNTQVSDLPQELEHLRPQLFLRLATMISKTYAFVSIYGIGLSGRIYSMGLQNARCIMIHAYDPVQARTHRLFLDMLQLEDLFHQQSSFLDAGRKHDLCDRLILMLYFDYAPAVDTDEKEEESPEETTSVATSRSSTFQTESRPETKENEDESEEIVLEEPPQYPILRISPEIQPNYAKARRRAYFERISREEEDRRRRYEALMALPLRHRHRVVCLTIRIHGFRLIVSVYHFPTRNRTFSVVAYNPKLSSSYRLVIGIVHAATLANVFDHPKSWSEEGKRYICSCVVKQLRLVRRRDQFSLRAADRFGYPGPPFALEKIRTKETIASEVVMRSLVVMEADFTTQYEKDIQKLEDDDAAREKKYKKDSEDLEDQMQKVKDDESEQNKVLTKLDDGSLPDDVQTSLSRLREDSSLSSKQLKTKRKEIIRDARKRLTKRLKDLALEAKTLSKTQKQLKLTFRSAQKQSMHMKQKLGEILKRDIRVSAQQLVNEANKELLKAATTRYSEDFKFNRFPKAYVHKGALLTQGVCLLEGQHYIRFRMFYSHPKTGLVPKCPVEKNCSYEFDIYVISSSKHYQISISKYLIMHLIKQHFPKCTLLQNSRTILPSSTEWHAIAYYLLTKRLVFNLKKQAFEVRNDIYGGRCLLEADDGSNTKIAYHVQVLVLSLTELEFAFFDPLTCHVRSLLHPVSEEVISGFLPLTFQEQTVQLTTMIQTMTLELDDESEEEEYGPSFGF